MSHIEDQNTDGGTKKKISLAEAMRQKLANKKQVQSGTQNSFSAAAKNQTVKSQQTKKANNQRKRTGV